MFISILFLKTKKKNDSKVLNKKRQKKNTLTEMYSIRQKSAM